MTTSENNELADVILKYVNSLKFGQVLITVHDSKVVQIEKVERIRLDLRPHFEKGAGI